MLIGTASLFLREYSLLEGMGIVSEAGYDCLEIWADHLREQGDDPESLRHRAGELGLGLTLHAPSYDLNPFSTNPGVRRESERQIFAALELAPVLGAELIVVHPGRLTSSWDTPEGCFPRLLEFAETLGGKAGELGIEATMELMEVRPKEFFQTPEDAARLMERNIPNLGLTVDIAHLHTLGGAVELFQAIDDQWISHIHLSDSGPGRTHLPLGQGEVDIAGVMAAISPGYSGIVNIEGYVPGKGKETIAANIRYLRTALEGI